MKQEPAQKVRSRLGVEGGGLGVQSGGAVEQGRRLLSTNGLGFPR